MSPFEWAMIIMSALSTANTLAGTDVETETPAPTGGGENVAPLQVATPTPGLPDDIPDLTGPTKALAAIKPQFTSVQTPPKLETPPGALAAKGGGTRTPAPKTPEPKEPPDIGKILAAIGPALQAVVPLLGLNDQRIPEQRPAPISGSGSGGGLVGQFAQQFGNQKIDIGQLLAALPGIRG